MLCGVKLYCLNKIYRPKYFSFCKLSLIRLGYNVIILQIKTCLLFQINIYDAYIIMLGKKYEEKSKEK